MASHPELIFCYGKNPAFAPIAIEAGFRYGAQLPCATYAPVYFADNEYRKPDRAAYMAALAEHRPPVATVVDWMRDEELGEVLAWAEEAARHCERLIIIPKVSGGIARIPHTIGGKPVILGYSVPTSHGGTDLMLWEFASRPIHLLGGSPQRQMHLYRHYLRDSVVSVDGNMHCQQANSCRFWDAEKGEKGHWRQLREIGVDLGRDNNLEAFRRSCENIAAAWLGMG